MSDLIEKIGPLLGVAAFLGLAVLAFLIFQQAREVRRLREWAGRAPERAGEAAEATAAAAEARGEEAEAGGEEAEAAAAESRSESRLGLWWAAARERLAGRWAALDRRSPVDPRYLVAVIAAGVVAAAVLTGGFGILGDDGAKQGKRGANQEQKKEKKTEVTILNATQEESATGAVIVGVPGLATDVAEQLVKPAGFKVGDKADAQSGFPASVIMFEPGAEEPAQELAAAVEKTLGETEVQPIVPDVSDLASGAPVVLVVGQDDANALGSAPG